MAKKSCHHLITNFSLRLLSFLFLIFFARFSYLLYLSSPTLPSSSADPFSLLQTYYVTVFQTLVDDGFLSLKSKSLCLQSLTGKDVAALRQIGVKRTGRNGSFRFKNGTLDFIFSSNLERSSDSGKIASEITRTLRFGGFLVVHTKGNKDEYSISSLLSLFPSFGFVRSRLIDGVDLVREVILIKQNRDGKVVNKCSVQGYYRDLVRDMEPLVTNKRLRPWVTSNRRLKNVTYLPSIVDISFKTRYVYIDVGARHYGSSIGSWFRKQYPKQEKNFQVFAIEANSVFHDEYRSKKRVTLVPYAAWTKNETLFFEIKRKQVKKNEERGHGMGKAQSAQSSINFVDDVNKIEGFDFVDWLKGLVSETDFVVVKMDADGSEFHLIPKLVGSGVICLVDELFIECHYDKKDNKYQKSYEDCLEMFSSLRNQGVFVHQWW